CQTVVKITATIANEGTPNQLCVKKPRFKFFNIKFKAPAGAKILLKVVPIRTGANITGTKNTTLRK
ncbi:unnamed protein product, partial [marine sediment metagenome]